MTCVSQVTVPVLFCLIIIVGVAGNVAVILVIVVRQQGMAGTVLNQLLLNLAASDFLFLVLCIPLVTYHYSADNWVIGEAACRLHHYVLYVCVYVTVYTLVSIAAARFMSIVHPNVASRLLTRRTVSIYLVVLWLVVGVVNVPVSLIYTVKESRYEDEDPYFYCGMVSGQYGQRLFTSFSIFAYGVPITITGALYVAIAHQLRHQMKCQHGGNGKEVGADKRRPQPPHSLPLVCRTPATLQKNGCHHSHDGCNQQSPSEQAAILLVTITSDKDDSISVATETFTTAAVGASTHKNWRSRAQKRNQHAIRLLVTVVVIFALCWLPLHVHLLLVYFVGNPYNSRIYELFRVLSHCLAYSNCCMNPIIYNYTSPDFRRSFRELLRLDRVPCLHNKKENVSGATQTSMFERDTTIGARLHN